jgi:hypothetical protein
MSCLPSILRTVKGNCVCYADLSNQRAEQWQRVARTVGNYMFLLESDDDHTVA